MSTTLQIAASALFQTASGFDPREHKAETDFLTFASADGTLARAIADAGSVDLTNYAPTSGKFTSGYFSDWIICFIGEDTGESNFEVYFKN
jgi:hypothetical protein